MRKRELDGGKMQGTPRKTAIESRDLRPVALGLYTSCQVSQNYYQARNMEVEARVFEAYMRRIEDKYGGKSG